MISITKYKKSEWLEETSDGYNKIIDFLNTKESLQNLKTLTKTELEDKESFFKRAYQKIKLRS